MATDEDRAAQAMARMDLMEVVAAIGAEQEAEEEAKEAADPRERWLGKLTRRKPRYTPSTCLPPGVGRWGAARDLLEDDDLAWGRVAALQDAMDAWDFARRVGFQDYCSPAFIVDAHRWNIQCQKQLTKGTATTLSHEVLVSDIPARFKSAIGDHKKEINDMVRNHEGEVREIDGAWVKHEGVTPTPQSHPALFQCQYALTRQEYLTLQDKGAGKQAFRLPDPTRDPERRYNNILAAPAFGGGGGSGFNARACKIMSLAELFWFWGNQHAARELYNYYIHARRLVLNRPHPSTNEERRAMVKAHHATEGFWGLGNIGVGEHARPRWQ